MGVANARPADSILSSSPQPSKSFAPPDNTHIDNDIIASFLETKQKLQKNLVLSNNISILEGTNPEYFYSPGLTTFDWKKNQCIINVHSDIWQKGLFRDYWSQKYFIYHELMHCRLYTSPLILFADAPLPELEKKLLNDFFYLEIFKIPSGNRMITNGFWHFHEAYADLLSLALLKQEGLPQKDLIKFLKMRQDNFLDSVHFLNLKYEDFDIINVNDDIASVEKWAQKKIEKILVSFWQKTYYTILPADFIGIMKNNATGSRFSYFNSTLYGYQLTDEEFKVYNNNLLPIARSPPPSYPIFVAITADWFNPEIVSRDIYWERIVHRIYGNFNSEDVNQKINHFLSPNN